MCCTPPHMSFALLSGCNSRQARSPEAAPQKRGDYYSTAEDPNPACCQQRSTAACTNRGLTCVPPPFCTGSTSEAARPRPTHDTSRCLGGTKATPWVVAPRAVSPVVRSKFVYCARWNGRSSIPGRPDTRSQIAKTPKRTKIMR